MWKLFIRFLKKLHRHPTATDKTDQSGCRLYSLSFEDSQLGMKSGRWHHLVRSLLPASSKMIHGYRNSYCVQSQLLGTRDCHNLTLQLPIRYSIHILYDATAHQCHTILDSQSCCSKHCHHRPTGHRAIQRCSLLGPVHVGVHHGSFCPDCGSSPHHCHHVLAAPALHHAVPDSSAPSQWGENLRHARSDGASF
jgi:hypothetical protein